MSITRRTVLASATLIPLSAIVKAQPAAPTALTPDQRKLLDAIIDRLIPTDELGPGAVESGVGDYIDRSLADYLAGEKNAFIDGLVNLDLFALRTQSYGFLTISVEKRDAVLTDIDTNRAPQLRGFFNRVRRLTLEGMFGDPVYGGNKNFAGWDLIRYPGAKLATSPQDQLMKTPPKPYRKELFGTGETHNH